MGDDIKYQSVIWLSITWRIIADVGHNQLSNPMNAGYRLFGGPSAP
jgi:hypothetical protein